MGKFSRICWGKVNVMVGKLSIPHMGKIDILIILSIIDRIDSKYIFSFMITMNRRRKIIKNNKKNNENILVEIKFRITF